MDPFQWLDAMAQAELVKKKEVKASELVDAAISRLERVNPQLNAVVTTLFDEAREAARAELAEGPFAGVPFLVKDLELMAAARYTAGSAFLKDFISPIDSPLMMRIRKAGLITLGKSNTPELGILPVTEPTAYGATRNPWSLEHTPGGSSGGAAAAVAAGIVPIANASDGGGSIRIPASCSGLFGLKVSRGRNPYSGVMPLSVSHALTRSVRDSAAYLDATGGAAAGDLYIAPQQGGAYLSEVGKDPGKLRIAFTTTRFDGSAIDPESAAAVQHTAKLLSDLGHHVEEAMPQIDLAAFNDAFFTLWCISVTAGINGLSQLSGRKPTADQFEPMSWECAVAGWEMPASTYIRDLSYMQQVSWTLAQFFGQYDVWLTPTLSTPPKQIGEISMAGSLKEIEARLFEWVSFTPLANATGVPAMSVPLYWTKDGLPVGSHFIAPFGDEATLLRLAAQLEAAQPWADRRPPIV